jgi:hypothetical protein
MHLEWFVVGWVRESASAEDKISHRSPANSAHEEARKYPCVEIWEWIMEPNLRQRRHRQAAAEKQHDSASKSSSEDYGEHSRQHLAIRPPHGAFNPCFFSPNQKNKA